MRWWIRKIKRFLLIVLVLGVIFYIAFRVQYRDTIRSLAKTQVTNATSDLINDAIDRQIESKTIQYDRIVYFEKDLNGKITALKTNMSEVNRLKTSILNLINDEILAMDNADIGIPLGSLFLPEFFSGKGPVIPVHILSIRNSEGAVEMKNAGRCFGIPFLGLAEAVFADKAKRGCVQGHIQQ